MAERRVMWLRGRLSSPWAVTAIVITALCLAAPALWSPFIADDDLQWIRMRPDRSYPGFDAPRFDFFVFSSGDPADRRALMDSGLLSWWAAKDFKLAFWRPLSTATHVIDFVLWGRSAPLQHLHNLAWLAALIVVTARMYRRLHAPWIAALATALYAWDDAHGMVVSFVANRNALIAGVLGMATLLVHDRAVGAGRDAGRGLAAFLYGSALLAGESAVATLGYLVAHACFLDPAPARRRALHLAPYAAITIAWSVVYRWLGYGVHGSGVYVHPQSDPLRFLAAAIQQAPVLLFGQVAGVPSDLWLLCPSPYHVLYWLVALSTLVSLVWILRPLLRDSAAVRFWAAGSLLSVVPICATFPSDRLLVFVGFGAMGVLAELIGRTFGDMEVVRPSRPLRAVVIGLMVVNLGVAPLMLLGRARTVDALGAISEKIDRSIPAAAWIADKTLVAVTVPVDGILAYAMVRRAALGTPRPGRFRILSTGVGRVEVERLDDRTLRVRPERGFLSAQIETMARAPSEPMSAGEQVSVSDMAVRVIAVDAHGRPLEAEFRFSRSLEDPSFVWMRWSGRSLVPWSPPAIGASESLPAIDPFEVVAPQE